MNTVLIILAIGAAIAAAWYFFAYRKNTGKGGNANPNLPGGIDWARYPYGTVPTSGKVSQSTALGITVYSEAGVKAGTLTDIDRAYSFETERARTEGGYTRIPDPSVIDVYTPLGGCVPSPEMKVPSFPLRAGGEWDGSQYDQYWGEKWDPPRDWADSQGNTVKKYSKPDGIAVVFAAEQVTGLSTPGSSPGRDRFVICESIAYEGACNGLQHILLAHNNSEAFQNSFGVDHQHPLPYPPVSAARGLTGSMESTAKLDKPAFAPVR